MVIAMGQKVLRVDKLKQKRRRRVVGRPVFYRVSEASPPVI